MTNHKTIIKRNTQLISRHNDNMIIILNPTLGKLFKFNQTATSIWRFLWRGRKIEEIIKRIKEEFDVSFQTAEKDTMEFIEEALNNKLLRTT